MDILYLSLRYPYPPTRGDRIRAFHFLKGLAARHRVSVVSFCGEEDESSEKALSEFCVHRWTVPYRRTQARWNAIKSVFGRTPIQNALWFSGEMAAAVRDALDAVSPDSVHAQFFRMAQYVADAPTPKLLDLCDSMAMNLQRRKQRDTNPLTRFLVGVEERRVRAYEPAIARRFDRVTFIAPPDRDALRAVAPDIRSDVIPSGVDLDFFDPNAPFERPDAPPVLLFTGTMDYFPNLDAGYYLANSILPRVRAVHRNAELHIVGMNPPERLAPLNGSRGGTVTGRVPDVRPYFDRATVFVAPMRCGSGLQTKNIEAMAMGVPLVTSSLGGNGMLAEPGTDYVRTDDTEGIVQAVNRLITDPDARRAFAERGRAYVEREHNWNAIGKRLCDVHEEMVRESSRGNATPAI